MQAINTHFRQTFWYNFSAEIDMLIDVLHRCPEHLWMRRDRFFFMAYHTTIFLDYYLAAPVSNFNPPLPYSLADPGKLPEHAIDDVIPNETYPRDQVQRWLGALKSSSRVRILESSDAELTDRWIQDDELNVHLGCPSLVRDYSLLEILFYNLRHIQHHIAQLNQLLRAEGIQAADWISQSD
jgi:hypothetical protein